MAMSEEQIRKTVDHPIHYQHPSGVECKELTYFLPAFLANALKYTFRAGKKEGVQEERDLRAALWYLEEELAYRAKSSFPNAPTELARDFSAHFYRLWDWAQAQPEEASKWLCVAFLGQLVDIRMKNGAFRPSAYLLTPEEDDRPTTAPSILGHVRIVPHGIRAAKFVVAEALDRALHVSLSLSVLGQSGGGQEGLPLHVRLRSPRGPGVLLLDPARSAESRLSRDRHRVRTGDREIRRGRGAKGSYRSGVRLVG